MKTSKFFALAIIFLANSSFRIPGSEVNGAQQSNYPNGPDYVVVIGAFSVYKNAVNFTSKASKLHLDAKYEINKNRNLYYVFVMSTDNRQQAIDEALRLRKESPYFDTWVFHGSLGQVESAMQGTDINPTTAETIATVSANDNTTRTESTTNQKSTAADISTGMAASTQGATKAEEDKKVESPDTEIEGKSFFFKIFRADDQAEIEGDVNVIDAERSRKIGTFTGNKIVGVADPKNKEGKVSFVCEVFGFRKVQRDLNYSKPEGEDITINESNATVIPFELVRLQKGDIAVMYNVFFFKDAAVMRPESRFEVTSLLNMLQENTKYKIKIHGHTNGGAHGRIISLSKGNDNYFALNDTKDGFGSAKALSEQRAEVVKEFLVTNGIDPKRMEIKAWGGKRPLYDKHSPQAQSNVRVEIEILEN
jgi:outer membrane protein OmpA-like peptidoglycan-associated protein